MFLPYALNILPMQTTADLSDYTFACRVLSKLEEQEKTIVTLAARVTALEQKISTAQSAQLAFIDGQIVKL